MARPYSLDLRERAVALARRGTNTRTEVSEQFGISERTLYDWLARMKRDGTLEPRPHGGGTEPLFDEPGLEILRGLVEERNDRTLDEFATRFEEERGIRPSVSVVCRALAKIDRPRKKSR